ncbi:hypothetical protein G9A89_004746 [Geosiphon pyriformis]|nr:hypothetical protein G9A89_004746 [Geosiphon pyriformis]
MATTATSITLTTTATTSTNDARAMQAIPYFLQDTANSWYQSLVNKPQDFNAFKIEFLRYFSNNNSINKLVNIFTIIKQGENKAVTIYLGCFHRNLHQIQAINPNYFTVVQILNQFIRGLCSSILQHIHSIHLIDLQAAITNARDFEAAELKTNHVQAINLVMNGSFELDSKLKQFNDSINQKLEKYLNQSHPSSLTNQQWQQETYVCHYCELLTYDATDILSTIIILNADLSTNDTSNLSATTTIHLLATASEDATLNKPEPNQPAKPIHNIPPATITKDESLAAIFFFELKETTTVLLFSGATLEKKTIIAMYTDAKVDDQLGRWVDRAVSAYIIIVDEATKTPIGEIDNFLIKINGIMILIKVFVIKATQYQVLVGNDWLTKTNAILD